jgi:hypothetical protein
MKYLNGSVVDRVEGNNESRGEVYDKEGGPLRVKREAIGWRNRIAV